MQLLTEHDKMECARLQSKCLSKRYTELTTLQRYAGILRVADTMGDFTVCCSRLLDCLLSPNVRLNQKVKSFFQFRLSGFD